MPDAVLRRRGRFDSHPSMSLANSLWVVVGRRKGEEGRRRPDGDESIELGTHIPTTMSCVRPSERPKLIDASAKGYFIRRPGTFGRTEMRQTQGR